MTKITVESADCVKSVRRYRHRVISAANKQQLEQIDQGMALHARCEATYKAGKRVEALELAAVSYGFLRAAAQSNGNIFGSQRAVMLARLAGLAREFGWRKEMRLLAEQALACQPPPPPRYLSDLTEMIAAGAGRGSRP